MEFYMDVRFVVDSMTAEASFWTPESGRRGNQPSGSLPSWMYLEGTGRVQGERYAPGVELLGEVIYIVQSYLVDVDRVAQRISLATMSTRRCVA